MDVVAHIYDLPWDWGVYGEYINELTQINSSWLVQTLVSKHTLHFWVFGFGRRWKDCWIIWIFNLKFWSCWFIFLVQKFVLKPKSHSSLVWKFWSSPTHTPKVTHATVQFLGSGGDYSLEWWMHSFQLYFQ